MVQKYKAFLQQTTNSRYLVMVQTDDGVTEVAGPDWYEDAVQIRDRFPAAPKPPKGWRLW